MTRTGRIVHYIIEKKSLRGGKPKLRQDRDARSALACSGILEVEEEEQSQKATDLDKRLQEQRCCAFGLCAPCLRLRAVVEEAQGARAEAGLLAQRIKWALLRQGDTGSTPTYPPDDE